MCLLFVSCVCRALVAFCLGVVMFWVVRDAVGRLFLLFDFYLRVLC